MVMVRHFSLGGFHSILLHRTALDGQFWSCEQISSNCIYVLTKHRANNDLDPASIWVDHRALNVSRD